MGSAGAGFLAGCAAGGSAFERNQARDAELHAAMGQITVGKSRVAAAKAIYTALHEAESLTVVVSPSSRQSAELVRKAEGFARRLGVKVKGDGANEISMALPNGSRIIGLPGTEATIRGYSAVSLLLVDEVARVSDELYVAIRPCWP